MLAPLCAERLVVEAEARAVLGVTVPRRYYVNQPPLDGREFRRLMDGQLKEAPWQKQVEEALTLHGWWWNHNPPNVVVCSRCRTRIYRGIKKGVPDIWAIRPPYMLWLELKTERGQLRPEQQQLMTMIRACGLIALYARPRDRDRVLDLIAHPELKADQWRARAPQPRASV